MWSISNTNYSKILVLDTEETIHEKGDPFSARNRLVSVQTGNVPTVQDSTERTKYAPRIWWIEHDQFDDVPDLDSIRREVAEAELIVGFNLKRDLLWLRRYGLYDPYSTHDLFDCQIAEFLLTSQKDKYPSLDGCCERYGVPLVSSRVPELWAQGIDTTKIDISELRPYALGDITSTGSLYEMQVDAISRRSDHFQTLMGLEMEDLKFIMEMEWNGVKFDLEPMAVEAAKLQEEIEAAENEIRDLVGLRCINLGSPDHRSAILFGGTIREPYREEIGVYKTGARAGEPKFVWREREHHLPQLCKPKRKLKKDGLFATDYDTLSGLRVSGNAKRIRNAILSIANLSKLRGTYLEGIPKRAEEMGWTDGIIHGHYNQTTVVTGRLSSSKPNMQNLDPRVEQYIVSRYAD